jgi:lysophospholipase L1-like esterase
MWPDLRGTSERIIGNLDWMVRAVGDQGKKSILFNVPYAHESMFPPRIREDLHAKRDYHNAKLKEYCDRGGIQLADICSRLRDEHFADELHPNGAGARIIAKAVFETLRPVYET